MVVDENIAHEADDGTKTNTTCAAGQLFKLTHQDVDMDWQEGIEIGKDLFIKDGLIEGFFAYIELCGQLDFGLVIVEELLQIGFAIH